MRILAMLMLVAIDLHAADRTWLFENNSVSHQQSYVDFVGVSNAFGLPYGVTTLVRVDSSVVTCNVRQGTNAAGSARVVVVTAAPGEFEFVRVRIEGVQIPASAVESPIGATATVHMTDAKAFSYGLATAVAVCIFGWFVRLSQGDNSSL